MPLSMSTSIMYYTVTPDRSNKSSRDQAPCNIVPAICLIPFSLFFIWQFIHSIQQKISLKILLSHDLRAE